jgi:ubiquinol oxidase
MTMMIQAKPFNIQNGKSRDYGFSKKKEFINNDRIPMSFPCFFTYNFKKEIREKRYGFLRDPYINVHTKGDRLQVMKLRKSLKQLKLNDKNIWDKEKNREHIDSPRIVMIIYYTICNIVDMIYKDKPIDRFWFLETVARMPYFSYVAILHLYETLGWWELGSDLKKIHYIEEETETHHLQIMESLGGDSLWWNRFIARHGAVAYYVILIVLFLLSPRIAYLSSELLEMHAVDTYKEFYESNENILKELPITKEAYKYDISANNLYDVFKKISEDEFKHAKSMQNIKSLPNN